MRQSKQKEIFGVWIGAHRGLLIKVVRAYAFTPDDREDLFQEIAVQLYNSVPNWRGDSAESTWVYRVALYSALAWTRKERKHRSGRVPLEQAEVLPRLVEKEDDRLEWLYRRIASLEEVDRTLMLLVLEGFGYREMAEILGISESNVGVKISRIKRRLATLAMEEATPC